MSVSFDAEHLVNLELNEQTGVGKPEQAIIRLHQLHASKLLQPAKVHLRLEKTHLLIVNRGTGVVVEKLPYPEVEAHNELFVRSVSDRHKNLLLLTVTDSLAVVPPEFFILQFASSSVGFLSLSTMDNVVYVSGPSLLSHTPTQHLI